MFFKDMETLAGGEIPESHFGITGTADEQIALVLETENGSSVTS